MYRILVSTFLLLLSSVAIGDTGLPWSSGFETGDFSEWNGYIRGSVTVSTENPQHGSYSARIPLITDTLNDNYVEHYFGDHIRMGLKKVEEVYLRLYSKFDTGYVWPARQAHKIALLNLTNGIDYERHYQVYIYVNSIGEYVVDHSYIDTWQFFGLAQNVGSPATVRFDQWDKLILYVKLNTTDSPDGIVKMWINDVLKIDHSGLNLRESTSFGINKLILSSYTANQSGSDGVQWHDNWMLSETDPDDNIAPSPPTLQSIE